MRLVLAWCAQSKALEELFPEWGVWCRFQERHFDALLSAFPAHLASNANWTSSSAGSAALSASAASLNLSKRGSEVRSRTEYVLTRNALPIRAIHVACVAPCSSGKGMASTPVVVPPPTANSPTYELTTAAVEAQALRAVCVLRMIFAWLGEVDTDKV